MQSAAHAACRSGPGPASRASARSAPPQAVRCGRSAGRLVPPTLARALGPDRH